ncbi:histidinol phosphate phosphatase [Enterococcus silesiacus]|nr:PHP domain-containing protein [Enterococcus silesiacus]ALS02180.1 histidinol phosphate phosphatase [Enterococcus silesiacus]
MNYYDQHVHTYFSFDSEEVFENYLKNEPDFFVSTDHFDLKNPYSNFRDDIPDYQAYLKKLKELTQVVPKTEFLKGIEIGVVPGQEAMIKEYLSQRPYDVKIMSIHQNGRFDYMDDAVLAKGKYIVAKEYFQQMSTVLDSFFEGDILAHFDYGLRRFDFTVKELQENYEDLLIEIFKKVIDLEMAVELNAKSFLKYNNAELYAYAMPLYVSLGGKEFTLGSDAHVAADYQNGFHEMSLLLKNIGIDKLTVFQGKERFVTELPTITMS